MSDAVVRISQASLNHIWPKVLLTDFGKLAARCRASRAADRIDSRLAKYFRGTAQARRDARGSFRGPWRSRRRSLTIFVHLCASFVRHLGNTRGLIGS